MYNLVSFENIFFLRTHNFDKVQVEVKIYQLSGKVSGKWYEAHPLTIIRGH